MARISRWFRRCSFPISAALVARTAAAGAPDPRASSDQVEEQTLDGEGDVEDIAMLHASAGSLGGVRPRGVAYVAVLAFAGERPGGTQEFGGMLVLGVPLDRLAGPGSAPHPRAPADAPADALVSADALVPANEGALALVPAAMSQSATERPDRNPAGSVVITVEAARACVRAAWKALGIADDANVDSMASRARASGALPEVRLRAMRTIDQSGRVTLTDSDPSHYTETGAATNWLEARLTFRLDRLIFADDEVSLERVRLERSELRARTTAKVLQALFEWQRAYALAQEPATTSAEHFAAVLRELEASAVLDVVTDGWFGRFRASLGTRGP